MKYNNNEQTESTKFHNLQNMDLSPYESEDISEDDYETDFEFEYPKVSAGEELNVRQSAGDAHESSSPKTSSKQVVKSEHSAHRERVREKFIKFGMETFTEIQVLEFMLFFAIPRRDTNLLAHKLLKKFGSIKNVLNADFYNLIEIDGIGENAASLIVFFRELYMYINTTEFETKRLLTSGEAGEFCCNYFNNHVKESFIVISLDSKQTIKNIDVISHGTENETAYYPREVVKSILKNRATTVILSHNHPGNQTNPSTNDILITNKVASLLDGINVTMIDHIICSGMKYISLSDRGLINC